MAMTSSSFLGLGPHGFHRVAYTEWVPSLREPPTLVCAHGLTRNGRDFDFLARALEPRRRVVCPDMPGRGGSEWLPRTEDYGYPVYLGDMVALIARLGVDRVDWLGTSMGGLIGMMLAAQSGTPIRRLVLNDVGPFVPRAAVERISEYAGTDPRFSSLAELEAYLRSVHTPFGPLTDEQWRHLATHGARRTSEGCALHYDPAIAAPLRSQAPQDLVLWPVWDTVRCPVLVLRGAESDVLSADTAQEMRQRGPGPDRVEIVEIPGVGHAPALMDAEQTRIVAHWLSTGVAD